MEQSDDRDSFEARALELINPGDKKKACREQLRLRMRLLALVRDDQDAAPSRAESRDEMQAVAAATQKLPDAAWPHALRISGNALTIRHVCGKALYVGLAPSIKVNRQTAFKNLTNLLI
jgi:hypothetical protein